MACKFPHKYITYAPGHEWGYTKLVVVAKQGVPLPSWLYGSNGEKLRRVLIYADDWDIKFTEWILEVHYSQ